MSCQIQSLISCLINLLNFKNVEMPWTLFRLHDGKFRLLIRIFLNLKPIRQKITILDTY